MRAAVCGFSGSSRISQSATQPVARARRRGGTPHDCADSAPMTDAEAVGVLPVESRGAASAASASAAASVGRGKADLQARTTCPSPAGHAAIAPRRRPVPAWPRPMSSRQASAPSCSVMLSARAEGAARRAAAIDAATAAPAARSRSARRPAAARLGREGAGFGQAVDQAAAGRRPGAAPAPRPSGARAAWMRVGVGRDARVDAGSAPCHPRPAGAAPARGRPGRGCRPAPRGPARPASRGPGAAPSVTIRASTSLASARPASHLLNGSVSCASRKARSSGVTLRSRTTGAEKPRRIDGIGPRGQPVESESSAAPRSSPAWWSAPPRRRWGSAGRPRSG